MRCDDGSTTGAVLAAVQADGRFWCGPTRWHGEIAMCVSVSARTTGRAVDGTGDRDLRV